MDIVSKNELRQVMGGAVSLSINGSFITSFCGYLTLIYNFGKEFGSCLRNIFYR